MQILAHFFKKAGWLPVARDHIWNVSWDYRGLSVFPGQAQGGRAIGRGGTL